MVAMALSGFTEEPNALWRKTCSELRVSLKNAYLRAMFAFLAGNKDSYEDVLVSKPDCDLFGSCDCMVNLTVTCLVVVSVW